MSKNTTEYYIEIDDKDTEKMQFLQDFLADNEIAFTKRFQCQKKKSIKR